MKNMPKSLHTVTVLAAVAKRYVECERYPAEEAVQKACEDLGYPGYPVNSDDYGLKAKAVKLLSA